MSWPDSSKCVAKLWRREWQVAGLLNAGRDHGSAECTLHHRFVQVVPSLRAGVGEAASLGSGKDVLPREVPGRSRLLGFQRSR